VKTGGRIAPIISCLSDILPPRLELLSTLVMIIDEPTSSHDDISPYELAEQILDFIERKINSVDHEGTVIYRV
jgi:hypothetical protein